PIIYVHASLKSPVQTNLLTLNVQIKTKINTRFAYGILTKGTIGMSGNGARIDSFNSTNVLYSTFGMYDPLKAMDTTKVATTSKTGGAVSLGNVSIYGYVSTGPGGSVTLGPNGNVGSTLYNDNPIFDGNIQAG